MTTNYTPRPGYGLLSEEPCSACGKYDKWIKRGWCASCYQRWDNNGRPETGPPRIYSPRTTGSGTCTACGQANVIRKTSNEWCLPCYWRWLAAGKPATGPQLPRPRGKPPAPVGECRICGEAGKLRIREGWCRTCHQSYTRLHDQPSLPGAQLPPEERRRERVAARRQRSNAELDKLARLRVMWALTRSGEENPYECAVPTCHETADPARRNLCAMHDSRLSRSGAYHGDRCVACDGDIKGRGGRRTLCDLCQESWGYCGSTLHDGCRLLPREQMGSGRASGDCKACHNRRQREKRRVRPVVNSPYSA